MNILYLNHYAGAPQYGMEFRPYYLAREWVRAGHRVRIVAADFSHVRACQPTPRPRRRSWLKGHWHETMDGIDYQWFVTSAYQGNGIARVFNIVTFLARLAMNIKHIAREFKPDVVIASSTYPMDIWPAIRLARKSRAKLVFEVHDLWPLSLIEIAGMSPRHPFVRVCQWAENTAYRTADLVVSILPNIASHAYNKGLESTRLALVPNGTSIDEWSHSSTQVLRDDVCTAITAARAADHTVIAYAGSHGLPNALDTLLDAALLLREEPVSFILVGDGHERKRLQARVEKEGLVRVRLFAPIPKAQIPVLLARVDAAYLGAPRCSIYRFGMSTNKMIDYMMAGVPIIYAVEAGNDPITEAGCGLTVSAENGPALADAIRQLMHLSVEQRQLMGDNGKRYALANHMYASLARKFLHAIYATHSKRVG